MINGLSNLPEPATLEQVMVSTSLKHSSTENQNLAHTHEAPGMRGLPEALLNAVSGAVLVLDREGGIRAVNQGWRSFAMAHAPLPQMLLEGANYLAACEAGIGFIPGQGSDFLAGLQAVLRAEKNQFAFEYTLNTPAGKKHLVARASLFATQEELCVLVCHEDVTYYKQVEVAVRKTQADVERMVRERTADLELLNGELVRQIRERKRLEKELLEITDRERRSIGIDLHDELGQQLTGLVFMAKGLELKLKGSTHSMDAVNLHRLLCQALNDTRAFAKNLAVMESEDLALPILLKNMAKRVRSVFKISCKFSKKGKIPSLDATSTRQLFNIAREAATNALKHGKAQQVWINLNLQKGRLLLEIRNDGQPFSGENGAATGMGLRNMRYRAGLIGATLEIKTGPGKITIVRCSFPICSELGPLFEPTPGG